MQHLIPKILHLANRDVIDKEKFYPIKQRILKKYGSKTGSEIQFIEGKKCWSCNGTGIHDYYDRNGLIYDSTFCWHCDGGWYKKPTWVLLAVYQFGKYSFHVPIDTTHKQPPAKLKTITGYINHKSHPYSRAANLFFFLLFDFNAFKKHFGTAHHCKVKHVFDLIENIVAFFRWRYKVVWKKLFPKKENKPNYKILAIHYPMNDDLPF